MATKYKVHIFTNIFVDFYILFDIAKENFTKF